MKSRRMRRMCLAAFVLGSAATALLLHTNAGALSGARAGEYQGGFTIRDQRVIPDSRYVARFRILGAEISASGEYDIPVTVMLTVGSESFSPFGSYLSPTGGNVNGGDYPMDFIPDKQFGAGVAFQMRAQSWLKRSGRSGKSDSDWQSYLRVTTTENSPNMLVLRNGDPVPKIKPFMDQNEISHIVRDYVNPATNRIRLWEDEVIYLFELGTKDLSSDAADFQDLVVLVTLAEDHRYFEQQRFQPNALFD